MSEEEELLSPRRRPGARRMQVAAAILAALVLAGLLVARVWPHHSGQHVAAPMSSTPTTAGVPPPRTAPSTSRPWPTAHGACQSSVDLPIVSSRSSGRGPDITVLIGGNRLNTVNLRSGRATPIRSARLRHGEYVVDLSRGARTAALVAPCNAVPMRVLRLGSRRSSAATLPRGVGTVLTDQRSIWQVVNPRSATGRGYLVRLGGGKRVPLPPGLFPDAVTRGVVVGTLLGSGSLVAVDAATGHRLNAIGNGALVAVGQGIAVWTARCDLSVEQPCTLLTRAVRGGPVSRYRLPRPPGWAAGTVSPDGRVVAFALQRAGQDQRYLADHPIPPSDIVLLHLGTGRLDQVPGVEIPAKSPPGLAFSPDSRWILIGLDAGSSTRLLAWRPGLDRPYETTPIAGPALAPPPIAVR